MTVVVISDDRVEVSPSVTDKDLLKLGPAVQVVQFGIPLNDSDHEVLSRWFDGRPDVTLRVYGKGATDLEFLRWYPSLTGFSVDCAYVAFTSVEGLRYLPDQLRTLSLGIALPEGTDLAPLERLQHLEQLSLSHQRRLPAFLAELHDLRSLYIEGPVRDLEAVGALTGLKDLTLRSVTVDLSPLQALSSLDRLVIKLGGSNDLRPIPQIGQLTYLELWKVRGLVDVEFLGELEHLEGLFLQALRGVERLPDLNRCVALKDIRLETMKGLHDLTALITAPALTNLRLVDAGHLTEGDLQPLMNLSLQEFGIGLGSNRKNNAARRLLRLPGSYGGLLFPVPPSETVRSHAR